MADKAITELVEASQVTAGDLFVLQQDNTAKKLSGQTLINYLLRMIDGHGGITSYEKVSTSGLKDTYRFTFADESTYDLVLTNGRAITSVRQTAANGLTRTYTIAFNDNSSETFQVKDGRAISSIKQTGTSGLTRTYTISFNDGSSETFTVTDGRSITGFSKTGTSGLVDTYTLTYNDGTTGTLTVKNGEKGDKGDNVYLWIKYASQEPTDASHSMSEFPDNWIGIYSGTLSGPPVDWEMYTWFKIKGEKGDTGDPATVISNTVDYQVSTSGSIIPSGSWQKNVPVVPQGQYLWTRTVTQFNTGNPVTAYSVARFGLDGSGSVSSVANISPDENGNVPLKAADIGALPETGGDLLGELRMNGQPISGLNPPTSADQAANMGFVNQQVRKAAPWNLLNNSYFRNPANQRGQSSYVLGAWGGCTIDRWQVGGRETSVTLGTGGLSLTGYMYQIIPNPELLIGKTVTLAYKVNGSVYCGSGVVQLAGTWNRIIHTVYDWGEIELCTQSNNEIWAAVDGKANALVEWAALYEGEYTEDTLPEYQPKGYGVELAECQRYFRILKGDPTLSGYIGSVNTTVYCLYNEKKSMIKDTLKTVTVHDDIDVICNGTYYTASVVSALCDDSVFSLQLSYKSDAPPAKTPCMLFTPGEIQISAEPL